MSERYTILRISKIIEETFRAKTFILETTNSIPLLYNAGQFVTLVFNNHTGEVRRSFSFSSSPEAGERPAITIKYIENGEFSRKMLSEARVGDMLQCAGINGFFTLPDPSSDYTELFYFAAGSGITPVFSMIKTALLLHPDLKIRLVYSNSNREQTIFYQQLSSLQEKYKDRFSILFLFSNSKDLMNARLNNFMVSGMVSEMAGEDFNKVMFYVCGPLEYMDNIIITLLTERVPKQNIRKEIFSAPEPEMKELPPDTEAHQVIVHIKGRTEMFTVQYPDTILAQARARGLALPYSCESGQCGSCTARCVRGKVWMFYNEVLTDKELDQGLVLTCTGFAVGGDVELQYE